MREPRPDAATARIWLVVALALTGALAWAGIAWPHFGTANASLLLLLPVVLASAASGRRAGLAVALLAGAVFNFVALEPRLTFDISRAGDLLTLAIYALVAIVTGTVASRLAEAGARARADAAASAAFSNLTQRLLTTSDPDTICAATAAAIGGVLGHACTVAQDPQTLDLEGPADDAAARWALAHRDVTGRGQTVLPAATCLYLSSHTGHRALLAQVDSAVGDETLIRLARSFLDEAADCLDRVELATRIAAEQRAAETETMRQAVFASIGHDLRTPMASLRAGLEALAHADPTEIDPIRADALRLERTLENLLELARFQAAGVTPSASAVDLTDTIDSALAAMPAAVRSRVRVAIAPDTPLVRSDPVMLHHIVVNLLENAVKYSPAASPVAVEAMPDGIGGAVLTVTDSGPGIGEDVADLFALFRRGRNADSVPGSGVGLSVVDSFARALGHDVSAVSRKDGAGTRFAITFGRSEAQ